MRRTLTVQVDRVEEGIAVCHPPASDLVDAECPVQSEASSFADMIDVPLPEELKESVRDGAWLSLEYEGDTIVRVCQIDDPRGEAAAAAASAERRKRLDRLFGRKK